MSDNKNVEVVERFAEDNKQLIDDVKKVFVTTFISATGYFLVQLGNGLVSTVSKNGIKVADK